MALLAAGYRRPALAARFGGALHQRFHHRPLSTGGCPDENLQAVLGRLEVAALPATPTPGGLYVPTIREGNLLYVSGHIPYDEAGERILGLAASDDDIEATRRAAALNALSILSTVHAMLGSLRPVKRLLKSFCMVNCSPEFGQHPLVMNGYSEVMQEVFGPVNGVGVRSAVGMALPYGVATEVECIFELQASAAPAGGGGDVFSEALGAAGLPEAVEIVKAGAPKDWLIYSSAIESSLKAHFANKRAEAREAGGIIL